MNHSKNALPKRGGLQRNMRPVFLLLLIPMGIGIATAAAIFSGLYRHNLTDFGIRRLADPNWPAVKKAMEDGQPDYVRKFAYYKVKDGQDALSVGQFFGVSQQKLKQMNPGTITGGTTVKLPPIEQPYKPVPSNGRINQAVVTEANGIVRISNKYRLRSPIITNIPELAQRLQAQGVLQQTGPKTYRLNKPLSVDGDIRVDITSATVSKLELTSTPDNITCLCFDQSAVLLDGVEVVSYDPATKRPDTTYVNGRSFVRMKNGRMDVLNSTMHYLGNALEGDTLGDTNANKGYLKEGGVYGVSWRISSDTLGVNTVTGWVEHSSFEHNHFGTYSFGASGMTWKDSYFAHNDIYGLDPHDDSNNALIEGNIFEHNGKHGFIVSKRCNYNIIRNNYSANNKLHGYMLHQDSAYNLLENNISYGNEDGFVIYESNYNTVRNNISLMARSAHIRVNRPSNNTYITGNQVLGGKRGVYLYEGPNNVLVSGNTIMQVGKTIQTQGVTNVLFADNTIDALLYDIGPKDGNTMIYGMNTVDSKKRDIPTEAAMRQEFIKNHPQTRLPN